MSTRTFTVPVGDRDVEAIYISDTDEALAYLAKFADAAQRFDDFKVGLDTETDSSKPEYTIARPGPLRTLQVAGKATLEDGSTHTRALVIDMRDVDAAAIAPVVRNLPCYVWNVDFDYKVLARDGIWLTDVRDLLYADMLLRNGKTGAFYRGLAVVSQQLLGVKIEGKGTVQTSYDADTDLTDDQIIYAARDAIVTVDLAAPLEQKLRDTGQYEVGVLEWRASRARMGMQLRGFGFNLDRYSEALIDVEEKRDQTLTAMARICGRGQGRLDFSGNGQGVVTPPFNPDSSAQVIHALNEYCADDLVTFFKWYDPVYLPAWAQKRGGDKRQLGDFESADSQTLTLINNHTENELVGLILEYRKWNQTLKNFSDEMFAGFSRTDPTTGRNRVHGTFTQLGTETGRWSSKYPNMQNQPKFTKGFFEPDPGKKIIHADYSSAEIALVAYVAGDESVAEPFHLKRLAMMATEFNTGGLTGDSHESEWKLVAGQMKAGGAHLGKYVELDVDALAERLKAAHGIESDPHGSTALKMFGTADGDFRKAAKGVNFGINYGQGPRALALGLTERGTLTTPDEAKDHLAKHAKAHAGLAAYLKERDAIIDEIAANPVDCDWGATFELWGVQRDLNELSRELDSLPYRPDADDYADAILAQLQASRELRGFSLPDEDVSDDELREQFRAKVAWAQSFDGAIVLQTMSDEEAEAGQVYPTEPVEFTSQTISGRLRFYQLPTTSILKSLAGTLGMGKTGTGRAEMRERFAQENGIELSRSGRGGRSQPLSRQKLLNKLSDKDMLYRFVKFVMAGAGADTQLRLLYEAYQDVVRGHRNRFRNHAVQGGVGDVVEAALADVADMLDGYPGAFLVCTVHDSIVVEAPDEYAIEIAERMKQLMVAAFERFAPDVPCSVDADICHTYDDEHDALSEEELSELASRQKPKPDTPADPAAVPIAA